jgi:hypothetical protein
MKRVSGKRSPASEGPCAGRNLAGDEIACNSFTGGGVWRCREWVWLDEGVIMVVLDWSGGGQAWRIGAVKAGGGARRPRFAIRNESSVNGDRGYDPHFVGLCI